MFLAQLLHNFYITLIIIIIIIIFCYDQSLDLFFYMWVLNI